MSPEETSTAGATRAHARRVFFSFYGGILGLALGTLWVLRAAYEGGACPWALLAAVFTQALPLVAAGLLEDLLSGGPDPGGRGGLLFLLVALVEWWPLAVLGVWPELRGRTFFRWTVAVYAGAAMVLSAAAMAWIMVDPELLAR